MSLADPSDIWHDLKHCEAELAEARLRAEGLAEALLFANRDKAAAFALLREAWDGGIRYGLYEEFRGPGEDALPTFEEWVAERLGQDWVTPDPADSPDH